MTKRVFRSVLEDIPSVPPGILRDSDSRQTLEAGSSLADVQILVTVGSEPGVEDDAEALDDETIGDLTALDSKDAFAPAA